MLGIRLFLIGILASAVVGAGVYVMKLRSDNAILKANQVKLESAVAEQQTLIENQKKDLLYLQNDAITKNVVINLYAKAQVIGVIANKDYTTKPELYKFDTQKELVFIDEDKLFLELIDYKNEKNYFNLNISKDNLKLFVQNSDWYTLEAP